MPNTERAERFRGNRRKVVDLFMLLSWVSFLLYLMSSRTISTFLSHLREIVSKLTS